jgi:Domain of unknown function (DUF4112)
MAYARSMPRVERLVSQDIDAAMARITMVARLMDSLFAIPGTKVRVGLDAIIGLVPVVGDLISQAISTYIIWEAHQLGVSKLTLLRMFANTIADTFIGAVPVAGDLFDVAFRANMKNLRLLEKHLENRGYQRRGAAGRQVIEGDWRRVA